MTTLSRKQGYSNNQLSCEQVKSQFQDFGNYFNQIVLGIFMHICSKFLLKKRGFNVKLK